LNADKPRVGRRAVVNHVEPVPLAEIARLGPLIGRDLHLAGPGAAFDLDAALLLARPGRQQIEAARFGQAGGAGQRRGVDIGDGRAGGFLVGAGDLHGDGFHVRFKLLLVGRVGRWNRDGVRHELNGARPQEVRLVAKERQGVVAAGGNLPLVGLHADQFQLCALVAGAGLLGELAAGGGEFSFLKVESAADERFAFGQVGQHRIAALDGHRPGHALDEVGPGLLAQCLGRRREPLGRAGQTAPAFEEQELLDRANLDIRAFVLADADQPAFDSFLTGEFRQFRVGLADDRKAGQMEQVGLLCGR